MFAYIGVGTNIGNLIENIKTALDYLIKDEKINTLRTSSLYITEPVGVRDQPEFINAVFYVETLMSCTELFLFLKNVEKKMGRTKTVKYGPRIIDLDLLFYEDKIYMDVDLTVPHPQLHKRSFVLWPLDELNNQLIHPLFNKSVETLKKELKNPSAIRLYENKEFPGVFK